MTDFVELLASIPKSQPKVHGWPTPRMIETALPRYVATVAEDEPKPKFNVVELKSPLNSAPLFLITVSSEHLRSIIADEFPAACDDFFAQVQMFGYRPTDGTTTGIWRSHWINRVTVHGAFSGDNIKATRANATNFVVKQGHKNGSEVFFRPHAIVSQNPNTSNNDKPRGGRIVEGKAVPIDDKIMPILHGHYRWVYAGRKDWDVLSHRRAGLDYTALRSKSGTSYPSRLVQFFCNGQAALLAELQVSDVTHAHIVNMYFPSWPDGTYPLIEDFMSLQSARELPLWWHIFDNWNDFAEAEPITVSYPRVSLWPPGLAIRGFTVS